MNSGHRGHREEPRVLIEEEVRILPSMGRAGRRRPPPRQHPQDHAGTEPRGDGDAGSRDTHAPERPAALASRPRTPPAWASCCRGPAVGHPTLPGKPAAAASPPDRKHRAREVPRHRKCRPPRWLLGTKALGVGRTALPGRGRTLEARASSQSGSFSGLSHRT